MRRSFIIKQGIRRFKQQSPKKCSITFRAKVANSKIWWGMDSSHPRTWCNTLRNVTKGSNKSNWCCIWLSLCFQSWSMVVIYQKERKKTYHSSEKCHRCFLLNLQAFLLAPDMSKFKNGYTWSYSFLFLWHPPLITISPSQEHALPCLSVYANMHSKCACSCFYLNNENIITS